MCPSNRWRLRLNILDVLMSESPHSYACGAYLVGYVVDLNRPYVTGPFNGRMVTGHAPCGCRFRPVVNLTFMLTGPDGFEGGCAAFDLAVPGPARRRA